MNILIVGKYTKDQINKVIEEYPNSKFFYTKEGDRDEMKLLFNKDIPIGFDTSSTENVKKLCKDLNIDFVLHKESTIYYRRDIGKDMLDWIKENEKTK